MAQAVTEYRQKSVGLVPQNMDEAVRLAKAMSTMKSLPDWLNDSVGDCLQVVEQAMRWGMSPFAVAQCTSMIHGKLMYEGKLVAAAVETSGMLANHFSYRHSGAGDDRAVTVSATIKGENQPRELTVVLKDVRTLDKQGKPNRQWTGGQIDQQLGYAGVRAWARRHTPAVMLGVYSREEFDAPQEGKPFTGPTLEAEAEPAEELAAKPDVGEEINDALERGKQAAAELHDTMLRTTARDAINAEVPLDPPTPPSTQHDRMVDWVEDTLIRIENCADLKSLFALIDELRHDRDTLHQQAPEQDKRLGKAIKLANTRLQPKPEGDLV